jgi:hypothetical protein
MLLQPGRWNNTSLYVSRLRPYFRYKPCIECSNERLGYCGGSCSTVPSFVRAGG